LLTLARLDSGKSATIDSACDLEAVVQTVLADIAHVAYDKGVELELTAAGSAQVRGNEALLKVLARNLIDNAVRYSGSDSKVVVNFDNTQDHIVMSVSDQGPGIASELKERVFARFFRVTGSKETGSGLGLSIVSRIVELHGATVHLHDAHPGPGLEVTVSFPTHRTRTLKV
jgi:signal transduction histidine kinase